MDQNVSAEDIIAVKREYHRKWRAANKDKVKASNERFWRKKAEVMKKKECKDE